jgi:hypothetical protein
LGSWSQCLFALSLLCSALLSDSWNVSTQSSEKDGMCVNFSDEVALRWLELNRLFYLWTCITIFGSNVQFFGSLSASVRDCHSVLTVIRTSTLFLIFSSFNPSGFINRRIKMFKVSLEINMSDSRFLSKIRRTSRKQHEGKMCHSLRCITFKRYDLLVNMSE